MKKVSAAILFELNEPLRVVDIDLPEPQKGEVMVKVMATGICHTQLLEISGKNATGAHNPNLMGHEGSGVVESVGEGVRKVKPGDHVVLSWIKGSGTNTCPKPLRLDGVTINRGPVTTFSDYTVVSENRVTWIPDEMPFTPAALVGCAVATGMGMVFNNAALKLGSSIMIIGCGGIGMNAIHAAEIAQARMIVAVDRLASKLEMAKKFGATHVVNSSEQDLNEAVKRLTGDEGLDYAIDTVGRKETMEMVYKSVKKISGRAILCGVPTPPGQTIEIDPFPLYYGRSLVGTSGGETKPDIDFEKYCRMYMDGLLRLDDMVTHSFPLHRINEGIELMQQGTCARVIINVESKRGNT